MMTRRLWFAAMVLLATATGGCNGCSRTGQETTPKVTIAESFSLLSTPLYLADRDALWKSNGLNVSTQDFTNGPLCLEAVLAGQADIGSVSDVGVAYAALAGHRFEVIATVSASTVHSRCVARADRGIREPQHLRGKKVGVYVGTVAELYMDEFLKAHRLTRADIQIVPLKNPQLVSGVVSGDLDACFGFEPAPSQIRAALGDNAFLFPAGDHLRSRFCVVCRHGYSGEQPQVVERILKSLIVAADRARTDPAAATQVVAERLQLSPDRVRDVWNGYSFDVVIEADLPGALANQANWAANQRTEPAPNPKPDFRSMIADRPLRALKPEAVTVPELQGR